jgi:hypothetical protein
MTVLCIRICTISTYVVSKHDVQLQVSTKLHVDSANLLSPLHMHTETKHNNVLGAETHEFKRFYPRIYIHQLSSTMWI